MATCTGCNREHTEISEYSEDNPVEEDGTFSGDKFVCTECYVKLIMLGLDVGTPGEIQKRAESLRGKDG